MNNCMEGVRMKLTEDDVKNIKENMGRENLESIMTKKFPDAELYITRGHDEFSYEYYTQDVHLDEEKAYADMRKIPSNGSPDLCDTYKIHKETPITLDTSTTFDEFDRKMIYDKLAERIIGDKL